ncbi:MAG: hypothetical protein AAF570_22520, partial [Bacteroidota bacterium]
FDTGIILTGADETLSFGNTSCDGKPSNPLLGEKRKGVFELSDQIMTLPCKIVPNTGVDCSDPSINVGGTLVVVVDQEIPAKGGGMIFENVRAFKDGKEIVIADAQ